MYLLYERLLAIATAAEHARSKSTDRQSLITRSAGSTNDLALYCQEIDIIEIPKGRERM